MLPCNLLGSNEGFRAEGLKLLVIESAYEVRTKLSLFEGPFKMKKGLAITSLIPKLCTFLYCAN